MAPCPRRHESERIGRNLRPRRDPLPLAELIGVTHRAVTEAVSGGAHAADRAIDPVHHRLVVDVDDARVKSVGDALGAREIGRHHCRDEAVIRRVGERDRLLVVPEGRDHRNRAEAFFVKRRHSGLNVGNDGRLEEESFARSASQNFPTRGDCFGDDPLDISGLPLVTVGPT